MLKILYKIHKKLELTDNEKEILNNYLQQRQVNDTIILKK